MSFEISFKPQSNMGNDRSKMNSVKVSKVVDYLKYKINECKKHNRKEEELAAYGGSMRNPPKKNYSKYEGLLSGLRYAPEEKTIYIPREINEDDFKDWMKEKKKRNDPEWEEYQRLKNKFED